MASVQRGKSQLASDQRGRVALGGPVARTAWRQATKSQLVPDNCRASMPTKTIPLPSQPAPKQSQDHFICCMLTRASVPRAQFFFCLLLKHSNEAARGLGPDEVGCWGEGAREACASLEGPS